MSPTALSDLRSSVGQTEYESKPRELQAVRAQLKTAQHALARHHQKLHAERGTFRDNARIE